MVFNYSTCFCHFFSSISKFSYRITFQRKNNFNFSFPYCLKYVSIWMVYFIAYFTFFFVFTFFFYSFIGIYEKRVATRDILHARYLYEQNVKKKLKKMVPMASMEFRLNHTIIQSFIWQILFPFDTLNRIWSVAIVCIENKGKDRLPKSICKIVIVVDIFFLHLVFFVFVIIYLRSIAHVPFKWILFSIYGLHFFYYQNFINMRHN